jgi:hypothetical protein
VIDMTLPGDFGTWHAPLLWYVAQEDAALALEEVGETGQPGACCSG